MDYEEIKIELNNIKIFLDGIIEFENIKLENNLFFIKNYKLSDEISNSQYDEIECSIKKLILLDIYIIACIKYDLQQEPFIYYGKFIYMIKYFEFHKLEVFINKYK